MTVRDILVERGATYGNFGDQAEITFDLKNVMTQHLARRNKGIAYDQLYALDMIAAKIARIINGDPNHLDSWVDIAGYATLVADRLAAEQGAPTPAADPAQMELPLGVTDELVTEMVTGQMADIPLTPEQVAALALPEAPTAGFVAPDPSRQTAHRDRPRPMNARREDPHA